MWPQKNYITTDEKPASNNEN